MRGRRGEKMDEEKEVVESRRKGKGGKNYWEEKNTEGGERYNEEEGQEKKRVDEEEGKEGEVRGWTKGKKEGRENG